MVQDGKALFVVLVEATGVVGVAIRLGKRRDVANVTSLE